MLAIEICALSVTICDTKMVLIRFFDLPKIGYGHELQRRRIRRWMAFCVAWKMVKKMAHLSKTLFVLSTNKAYTHRHMDEPTIAIGDNGTRCISPKSKIYSMMSYHHHH